MGVLLLVRHGQAALGTADYDQLSDLGREQARITGARLAAADLGVDRVVCGGLVRQRDTALAVLSELGRPPERLRADERLDEYDHVGLLAAHPTPIGFEHARTPESRRAVQSTLDEAIARWIAGGDGGNYAESHGAFLGRIHDALRELTAAPGATVAVTSAGVIAAACAGALGLPEERWPSLARMVVNAGVTKLISGRTGTHLLTFNDHAHLEHDRALVTYR